MKINSLLIAIICLLPCVAAAVTVDPPHGGAASGYNCASCHTTHAVLGGSGYDNICLNCHRPGSPKGGSRPFTIADGANPFNSMTGALPGRMYQTAHNWTSPDNSPAAGAAPPLMAAMTTNSLAARTGNRLACVRCHNQHDNSNPPFLRTANNRDQMCLDCHRSRNVRNQTAGSHPVNFSYTGAGSKVRTNPSQYYNPPVNANPGNPTADLGRAMANTGGTLLCSSCHGVHYTDSSSATFDNHSGFYDLNQADGNLLRTDLRGATADAVNICTNCHAGKNAHNGRGQDIQCADCHGGHVEYDANALTAQQKKPNVWLVRRYMQISTANGSARNQPVYFQSTTVKNYKDPAGSGVCQSCHEVPVGVGYPDAHSSFAAAICNQCHFHANPSGSFTATGGSCTSCHGYPPRANTAGGPNGYAVSSPFTSESSSGHAPHAGAAPYSRECRACHQGNSHMSGTFQDVFIDTTGLVSAFFGAVPIFNGTNPQAPGCSNVYCHSDGAPRNAALVPVLTTQAIPSWANGRGAIIGQPDECRHCHGDATTLSTNSHGRHLAASLGCVTCHSATAASNTSLKGLLLHANGEKNISFSNFTSTGRAVWSVTTATCSTLYCHSSGQSATGAGQPAYTAPLWGGAAPGCGGCHKDMQTDPAATGSHLRHAQLADFACATCHPGYTGTTANTATHVNSSINLGFAGAAAGTIYGKGTSYPAGSSAYSSCTAAYCHSTVQGFAGSGAGTFRQTPNWGGLGPLPCGTCHVDMSSNATATGSHIKHAQTYALSCGVCHGTGYDAATVVYPGHANRSIDLGMNGIANGTVYSKTASFAPGLGYGSCTASYCHGGTPVPPPVWGGAAVADCLGCHGNDAATASPIATGAHTVHINNAAVLGTNNNFACGECHAKTVAVASNRAVISFVTHVNGIKDYSGARAGGSASYNAATRTCSAGYCHSSGMKGIIAASQEPDPPVWGSGTLVCKACHGSRTTAQGAEFNSVNGEPNYVNGGAGTPTANSHNRHVVAIGITDTSKCSNCHYKTVDQNLPSKLKDYSAAIYHLNRNRDVVFRPIDGNTGSLNADGSCTNTYCHGTVSTRWGAAGSSNCASCHSASNVASSPLPGAHHIHYSSSVLPGSFSNSSTNISSKTAYRFSCSTCHAAGINKAVHADGPANAFGVAQVFFSMTSPGRNPVYNYSAATRGIDRTTFKWTAGGSSSCNATYCHSNGNGAKGSGIVRWDGSVSGSCTICHGDAATLATGAHQSHVNSATASGGINLVCIDCHALTVSSDTTVSDKSRHVNKLKDYSGSSAGGSAGYNAVTRVCSASYCHSNGKGVQTAPPAWNSGVNLDCRGCHGATSSVAGEPDYANGGAGAATANSHQKHVSARKVTDTTGCVVCHRYTVSGTTANTLVAGTTLHLNRQFEVNMTKFANSSGVYTPATKTCSNTYCHAGTTQQWGGPSLVCGQCHVADRTLAGGHSIHYDSLLTPGKYLDYSGNVSTPANYRFTCTSCHNATHADGPFNATTGQTAEVQFGYTSAGRNGIYTAGAGFSTDPVTGLTWTAGSCATTYCHSDGRGNNSNVTVFNWATPATPAAGGSCSKCHNYTAGSGSPMASGSHATHIQTYPIGCDRCHYATMNNGSVLSDKSKHINKLIDVTWNPAVDPGATYIAGSCGTSYCHSNGQTPPVYAPPVWGGAAVADCLGCHGNDAATASPIATGAHTVHINNAAVLGTNNNFACGECHAKTVAVASNRAVISFVTHVNGIKDYSGARAGGSASYNAATRTCSAGYCHSSGMKGIIAASQEPDPPVWGSGTLVCKACHGSRTTAQGAEFNSVNGEPNYVNGGAGTPTANSHNRHVVAIGITDTSKCSNCHYKTVDQNLPSKLKDYSAAIYHLNRNRDVVFRPIDGNTGSLNADGSCTNTYCHGTVSTRWGAAGSSNCASCHSASNVASSPLPGAHHIHYSSSVLPGSFSNSSTNISSKTAYRFSCSTCHAAGINKAVHADGPANAFGVAQVFFSMTSPGRNPVYNYSAATRGIDRTTFKWTAGGSSSCNATYCHSNGNGAKGSGIVRWDGSVSGSCTICHGDAATLATGAHQSHVNSATASGGINLVCIDCHALTVSSDTTVSDKSRHVNKLKDYSGSSAGGSAGYNAVTRVCSASYCHSNGKGVQTAPPAWNSGVNLDCRGCHGATSSVAGEPDYANGGAGAATANSHQKHVSARKVTDTTGCVVCHRYTVSGTTANTLVAGTTLHLNRQFEVNMTKFANSSGVYTPATKTCSNTYCHAGTTQQWGGPSLVCGQCHVADRTLAGGHSIHYDSLLTPGKYLDYSGNVSTPANYRFTCTSCHNATHADGPFNATTGQTAEVQFGYTSAGRNGIYTAGAGFSTDPVTGLTWTAGSCATTYCHSDGKGGNPNVTSFNWASATGTLTCVGCHDTKVTGATAATLSGKHDSHLNTTSNPSLGLGNAFNCVDCHAGTITNPDNTTLADKSKHINKLADYTGARAGGSANYNRTSKVCSNVYCHSNGNSGNPVFVSMTGSKTWTGNGSLGCNGCHGRTSSFGVPDYANGGTGINANNHARHLTQTGMTLNTTACSVCHLQTVSLTVAGQFKDFSAAAYHLNGNADVIFDAAKAGAAAAYGASTCSSVYCHSTVQGDGGSGAPVYQSPVWGQTSTGCNFCHADMSGASGTGGHAGHVQSSALACSTCHGSGYTAATVTYPDHVNNRINLHFTGSGAGTVYGNSSTVNPGTAYDTCFTSLCHGSLIVTASWGVTTPNPKCEKCHGYRSAPWNALNGDTDPAVTTAGTHFSHISSSGAIQYAKPFSCAECHAGSISLDSQSVTAAGHFDTPMPAEVVFGSLARTGGTNPVISIPNPANPSGVQCSNVYCHGATLAASVPPRTDPVWNNPFFDPNGGIFNCAFCHGYPPTTHAVTITQNDCITCHDHVNANGDGFTTPALHVNGIIEASGFHTYPNPGAIHLSLPGATTPATSCGTAGCHDFTTAGSYPVSRGIPPNCRACHTTGLLRTVATSSCWDCHGASDIDGRPNGNVFPNISGNHNVHMTLTGTSCNTCHTGFGSGSSKHGFSNTSTSAYPIRKVAFSGAGAAPVWTPPSRTCSGISCHGQGAPVWGARAGAPVNGFPYAAAQCEKCHGATTSNPFYSNAIPKVTANNDARVGAHFMHLTSSTIKLSRAVHCNDCHEVPAAITAATHMNGTTDLVWSALATNNGSLSPSYNATTGQCSNVYCHGAAMQIGDTSGTNRIPVWNVPFLPAAISAAACSNCHGFPPPTTSGHPAGIIIPPNFGNGTVAIGTTCSCHANINTAGTTYANIFVNKALHINGFFEPTSGAHEFPYSGSLHLSVAGTTPWAGCVNASCHANTAGGTYPVAVLTPPNCTGCHLQGLRAPAGTSSCYDCHGATATDGKPNGGIGTGIGGTTFPNYSGSHTVHITNVGLACANCHFNAGAGSIGHGNSNRTASTAATVAFNGLAATPTWTSPNCTAACHGAARWGGRLGCISCHSTAQASTHGTPRDAVTTEFGLAWGHKKAGRGAVTDADCIVCHLEGVFATQSKSARHGDGNIDLRDPDGVGEAAITNISGAAFVFKRFSTSYAAGSRTATGHLSNTDIANVITQKFCLACHDSNGATNTTARSNNGGTGTAFMVFGGINLGATYTLLNGAAAVGGVVDAKTQFAVANSSNHPVLGPSSKAYPTPARLSAPYNNFTRTAGTLSNGVVMNCFDCHNTTAPLMTTRTVSSHGNAVTIRGTLYAAATGGNSVVSPTFCLACHISGYNTSVGHGAGSAISTVNNNMSASRFAPCANCHFSSGFKPARPLQAADVHGFNGLAATGGAWTYGNANGMRPVALIRNVGRWTTTSPRPASAPGITAGTANCGGNMNTSTGGISCNDNMATYSPGGVF